MFITNDIGLQYLPHLYGYLLFGNFLTRFGKTVQAVDEQSLTHMHGSSRKNKRRGWMLAYTHTHTKTLNKTENSVMCLFGHWVSKEAGMLPLHFCHGAPNMPGLQTQHCARNNMK